MAVDWGLAASIARTAAGNEPLSAPPVSLADRSAAARAQVVAASGLQPAGELPPAEWVGREDWIDANLATMRTTLGPVLERSTAGAPGLLQNAAGSVAAAEIGGLLGLFSRRILGQYEINLLDPEVPPRLLLVGPNLDKAAQELHVDREELVTWVGLHEVTHAVQFGAVGWLRDHLAGSLRELLSALEVRPDPRALLSVGLDDLRELAGKVREGGLLGAVIGPERQRVLDDLQGTMGLVEGHAEWTMDRAGADVLADVDALRAALERRRADRAPLLRILDRLLGFDLKLRQYKQGREFCDAVVAARGDSGLLLAWASPETAPSAAELGDPAAWLRRTSPAAA